MNSRASILAIALVIASFALSCSKENVISSASSSDVSPTDSLTIDIDVDDDLDVDPCSSIIKSDPGWCACNPECCQSQQWFCQPVFGDPSYYKKEVIVEICNDDNEPCVYGYDLECPPPEIIFMGDCVEAYECSPMSQGLDYGWQWCEMDDGTVGKQNVSCDKGQLYTTPCQPCDVEICDGVDNDCDGVVDEEIQPTLCENECGTGNAICVEGLEICYGPQPQEEICDYLDNDCDGMVDEDQQNACGMCGSLPGEVCNDIDDDCDGEVDEDLAQICSTVCGSGVEVCNDGMWIGCTAQQPEPEVCDGLDNDCDGQIDEELDCLCTVQDVGKLFPCAEDPLLCGQGFKTCECVDPGCVEIVTTPCYAGCHWLTDPPGSDTSCDSLIGMALQEEECNAFDDNCNTLIDEDLVSSCYTGPDDTLGVGICEEGSLMCEMGAWGNYESGSFVAGLCLDEVLPKKEECNGIDDDCDGIIDWGEEVPETDVLFIVDWSGSMDQEIDAVLTALNQFASSYNLEEKVHWGLIVGPRKIGYWDEQLQLISDISPLPDFLTSFASLGTIGMSGGSEMLLDALYFAYSNITSALGIDIPALEWDDDIAESLPPKDQFQMTWRPGAERIIIVFSDEVEQSYLVPEILTSDIINACKSAPSSKLYTFSGNTGWQWDELADECGGKYFKLSSSATEMHSHLMEILEGICISEP